MPFNKNPSYKAAGHGGCLPVFSNPYTIEQRRRLALLAESNPTPAEYAQRKAEILRVQSRLHAITRAGG